jgi:hypothetical protein
MNQPSAERGAVDSKKPPRFPVRHSTAQVEFAIPDADPEWPAGETLVKVRCGHCGSRLFDIQIDRPPDLSAETLPDRAVRIIRKCPSCGLLNEGAVTAEDGRPLTKRVALTGPWICPCGKSLGWVDAIRGRIYVTCKCKQETRVVAAHVIASVRRATA